jgi:hypothetical protein
VIHLGTGFKADVYLVGRDPIQLWGLKNARTIDMGDQSLTVAAPEFVVLRKLEFYREGGSEKHLRDIYGILKRQPDLKTSSDLLSKVELLGLTPQWKAALSYRPN